MFYFWVTDIRWQGMCWLVLYFVCHSILPMPQPPFWSQPIEISLTGSVVLWENENLEENEDRLV